MVISELLVYITCINQYKTSMSPSQVTFQAIELLKIGLFQFLLLKTNIEFRCQFNPFQARSKFPPPPPPKSKDDYQMQLGCPGNGEGGHDKAIS